MEKLNWNTLFNTSGKTMTHLFGDRVCIISDFASKESKVYKDGLVIRTFGNDVPVDTYTLLLVSVAEDALKLDSFKQE